ncbi:MAG: hypothetical protein H6566_08545 [Lewinellaceae bacterium]|nr:hypothetical protein [Lewinellaceae bacterium]
MDFHRRDYYVFFSFLGMVQLLYRDTWNAGFVTDFTGLLWRLEGSDALGILDSFGFPALQPVLNAFLFIFYKTFGLNPLPWHLVFTSLHALNGFLAYRFGAALLETYSARAPRLIAFLGALFFLLSPYQSEVVTWRVCFNFLLSSFLVLSVLWQALAWAKQGRRRQLWAAHSLFALALFTFELALAVPLACLALLLLFPPTQRSSGGLARQLQWLSIPQFSMLIAYFVLNRLILGAWVGHYGPAVHLKFRLGEILANYYRFGFKFLAFNRYWPHPWKEGLSGWLQEPALLYPLALFTVLGLLFALARFSRWRGEGKASLLFLLLFIFALAPAINLYFNYLLYIENDRYGYLASAFFFLGLSSLLSLLPRWLYLSLSIGFIILSTLFLWRTNQYWKQSTALYYRLMDSFDWYDAPAVYLLNLPDNYQGAVLFRDFSGQGEAFRDALKYIKGKPYEGAIYEVAQYNLATPTDGVSVRRDSALHYTVEFNQWGNWWWRRGIGMGPGYDADTYSVESKGHFYHLTLDSIQPGAVLLYQEKGEWREVE